MSDLVVLAASFAVVVLMVGIAFALGFRARVRVDREDLERLLAASDPGARIAESAVAADGYAALARLTDGKLLVAKSMADRVSLRTYQANSVKLRLKPGKLSVVFADLGFPTLNMRLNDPPRWLTDLAAGGGGKA